MKANDQIKDFREKDERELRERYNELMKELFNLRFQASMAQLSSPARFKQVRKEIARLKTVAKERKIKVG
jgi:large subunit ribosomal protein L29